MKIILIATTAVLLNTTVINSTLFSQLLNRIVASEPNLTDPVIGLNLGNKAPEINLKNPSGQLVSLSSFHGKLVLIDFWASWCGPCRLENPYVVSAYQKYKNTRFNAASGFAVYSVSLDSDLGAWKKGIEKDGLIWDAHVSDLKGWNNEAALRYNINSIPTNVLLNENGIIIRKNIRGEDLEGLLQKLSKN